MLLEGDLSVVLGLTEKSANNMMRFLLCTLMHTLWVFSPQWWCSTEVVHVQKQRENLSSDTLTHREEINTTFALFAEKKIGWEENQHKRDELGTENNLWSPLQPWSWAQLEREKEIKNRMCSCREESLVLPISSVAKFAIVIWWFSSANSCNYLYSHSPLGTFQRMWVSSVRLCHAVNTTPPVSWKHNTA